MRWPDRLGYLWFAVAAWLLLVPAHAGASAGMSMRAAAGQGEMSKPTRPSAMLCPRCADCNLAPAPMVKNPRALERQPKVAGWRNPQGSKRAADGWSVLQVRAPDIPLRVAHCRWRD